jgi:hypothetical protein
MLVLVSVMTFFGAILQYENIMNLLSFFVYLSFTISFLLFLALTNDAILQNSAKVYKPESSITVVHRTLNIIAIIALVYHGYIFLPIVFILCLALSLMIREVIKREYELTLTEDSSKIASQ